MHAGLHATSMSEFDDRVLAGKRKRGKPVGKQAQLRLNRVGGTLVTPAMLAQLQQPHA